MGEYLPLQSLRCFVSVVLYSNISPPGKICWYTLNRGVSNIFSHCFIVCTFKRCRSCYFAAHKIEEKGFPPFICDMTGGTGLLEYTEQEIEPQEILDMEMRICLALEFRLHKTTPCSFRDRFIQASFIGDGGAWPALPNKKFISMVDYLLDVSLQSYNLISKSSSTVAASAVYLARKTLQVKDSHGQIWSPTLKHYTSYSACDMGKAFEAIEHTEPDIKSISLC